ncbi:hypothetical protein, partial [Desulfoluna spongiiphila]|uniref:hypothetical protein n=1 Tax=Desulfoluna spongiiphila TaxID=419481 RepID=UPI001C31B74D
MTLKTLIGKGANNSSISCILRTSEGTVRYHRKKLAPSSIGNRYDKESKASAYTDVISAWIDEATEQKRPSNIRELHEHLLLNYGYE